MLIINGGVKIGTRDKSGGISTKSGGSRGPWKKSSGPIIDKGPHIDGPLIV